ncbi:hypothetical protein L1049_003120 [Liquidambar formosana]|uniref:Malectin-like domain-containing protein n=1 Tax=Liquidambar formosana TaxID=63359 RepID=A0AAP0R9B9_LIQFO
MLCLTLHLSYLFLLLLALVDGAPPYTPTEYILLNCGSSSNATSPDGRNWESDSGSKFSPSYIQQTSSSTASVQDPSVTQVPYLKARISKSQFTYTFPVSAGPKFVRLYFYPATYSGHDKSNFFFSVVANSHTLLSNFSASLTVSAIDPPVASLVKEFCVNVYDNQRLTITFSPSPSSYAFINGIEIVSMPNNLYLGRRDDPIRLVNFDTTFTLDNNTALETVFRLNVGGQDVSINRDTGMFRTWRDDSPYIFGQAYGTPVHRSNVTIRYTPETPAYTAPAIVYSTARTMGQDSHVNLNYNLTWFFTVDSGFNYLVRLHFCETQLEVKLANQRVFRIYINNQTAEEELDVIERSGGTEIPMYRDYVVLVQDSDGSRSKQDLWLALHPVMDSAKSKFANALLNGLEIFKLNQSDGSLAAPNPDPMAVPTSPQPYPKQKGKSKSKGSSPVIIATGSVLGGVAALSLLLCFLIIRRRRRRLKDHGGHMLDSRSSGTSVMSSDGRSINSFDQDKEVRSQNVFSEIMNSKGR